MDDFFNAFKQFTIPGLLCVAAVLLSYIGLWGMCCSAGCCCKNAAAGGGGGKAVSNAQSDAELQNV